MKKIAVLFLLALTLCSNAAEKKKFLGKEQKPATPKELAEGYALLFKLLGDEKDVSKLRIIKHENPDLKELMKLISERSRAAYDLLEASAKHDANWNLKAEPIPAAEIETRKAISKTKTRQLLSSKGDEFELLLLLSQNEALTYGSHLTKVLADLETEPTRRKFLVQLESELENLQNRVIKMVASGYKKTPAARLSAK